MSDAVDFIERMIEIRQAAMPGGASMADRLLETLSSLADRGGLDALTFAGAVHAGSGLDLYATDAQAGERLVAQARSDVGDLDTPVRVINVMNSHKAMMEVHDRILADLETLREQGVELGSWGPDYAQNRLVVAVTSRDLDAATQVLAARYGRHLIAIVRGTKWISR